MRLKVTRSTGDVFRDLGFPAEEAEHLRIRSVLLIELQKTIGKRRLKQAEAARLLGVTQPRVSDLMRGRLTSSARTPSSTCWHVLAPA